MGYQGYVGTNPTPAANFLPELLHALVKGPGRDGQEWVHNPPPDKIFFFVSSGLGKKVIDSNITVNGLNWPTQLTKGLLQIGHQLTPVAKTVFVLYVREAYFAGIWYTAGGAFGFLLAAILLGMGIGSYRHAKSFEISESERTFFEASSIAYCLSAILFFAISLAVGVNGLNHLVNAEWVAIQNILGG